MSAVTEVRSSQSRSRVPTSLWPSPSTHSHTRIHYLNVSVDSRLDLGRDEQAVVHDRRAQQDGALETRREAMIEDRLTPSGLYGRGVGGLTALHVLHCARGTCVGPDLYFSCCRSRLTPLVCRHYIQFALLGSWIITAYYCTRYCIHDYAPPQGTQFALNRLCIIHGLPRAFLLLLASEATFSRRTKVIPRSECLCDIDASSQHPLLLTSHPIEARTRSTCTYTPYGT